MNDKEKELHFICCLARNRGIKAEYFDFDKRIEITERRQMKMPKVRPIDANVLKKDLSEFNYDMALRIVDAQPTIEPEVRYGQWIDNGEDKYICSSCKRYVYRWFGKSDFCPRCGAEMGREGC